MDTLQSLLENTDIPVVVAFLLGLLTAVSPCPLATNITAIGYICKDVDRRDMVIVNGMLYTLGRVLVYTLLGVALITIIREGADTFELQSMVNTWGAKLLVPALILTGCYMLWGDRLTLPQIGFRPGENAEKLQGAWGSVWLGMLLALAFCPSSALYYFGMLIPLAASQTGGELLPVVYAVATALPVIVVAWVLAYGVNRLGRVYDRMMVLRRWMNRVVGVLFVAVGCYYGYMLLF